MPQYDYNYPLAILGQLAVYDPARIDTLINFVPNLEGDVLVVTSPDGDYSITVQGEEGTFTSTFAASGNTVAQIADGLAAAVAANADMSNIATATSDTVDTVALDFFHNGFAYTVTVASPSSDMTYTETQSNVGSAIPLGIAVTSDDGENARLLTTGDTNQDVWGVVVRNADLVQQLDTAQASTTQFLPADALSVMREGEVWVAPEVAVSVNDTVWVRVTATGTEQAGAFSNVADGGDNVLIAGRWVTATTAAGQLARVILNTP